MNDTDEQGRFATFGAEPSQDPLHAAVAAERAREQAMVDRALGQPPEDPFLAVLTDVVEGMRAGEADLPTGSYDGGSRVGWREPPGMEEQLRDAMQAMHYSGERT